MDGTLTIPSINFIRLRDALGLQPYEDLLGVISSYNEEQKKQHLYIIEQYEKEALEKVRLQPDVNSVLAVFAAADLKLGIITRNSNASAEKVLSLIDIDFDPVLTRDFTPVKPDPAPINKILDIWSFLPENVLMVGDFRDDILCGKNAKTFTCFFSNPDKASYSELADFTISSFSELKQLILS